MKKKLATHEAWIKNLPEGRGAVFSGCDLRNFVFRGRDIRFAVFSGADLRGVNFHGVNLRGGTSTGVNEEFISRMIFGRWPVCVRPAETLVSCQRHRNEQWLAWTQESPEIQAMHPDASEWWRVHGDAIKTVIRCVMKKNPL